MQSFYGQPRYTGWSFTIPAIMRLDEPLSDDEFDELDDFLLSEHCAEDSMTMDVLHGYLTALAIGPRDLPMTTWLPRVWGSDPRKAPMFSSDKERTRIISLIARFMNEIAITFEAAPKEYEALFCEVETEDGRKTMDPEGWASGFWEAMQLCAPEWESETAPELASAMRAITVLGAEEIDVDDDEFAMLEDLAQRARLAREIEAAMPALYRFWQPRRRSSVEPVLRDGPKNGRNDPCPCGSGKKFKKCCGGNNDA